MYPLLPGKSAVVKLKVANVHDRQKVRQHKYHNLKLFFHKHILRISLMYTYFMDTSDRNHYFTYKY